MRLNLIKEWFSGCCSDSNAMGKNSNIPSISLGPITSSNPDTILFFVYNFTILPYGVTSFSYTQVLAHALKLL